MKEPPNREPAPGEKAGAKTGGKDGGEVAGKTGVITGGAAGGKTGGGAGENAGGITGPITTTMIAGEAGGAIPAKPVTVTINGKPYAATLGEVLLAVAVREKVAIPHLCYEASLDPYGACRLCMVEVVRHGKGEMITACTLRVTDGLTVLTDTPDIVKHRNLLFELYLAEAGKSEVIREMAARYGVTKTRFLRRVDHDDPLLNKCVLCGLCVRACNEIMGAGAISYMNRGPYTVISTPFSGPSRDCLGCGACAAVCPTRAVVIEDTGSERVMKSWGNTRVPLAECVGCGQHYAPQALAASILARLSPSLKGEVAALCPACRGKRIARAEVLAQTGSAGHHD